MGCCSFRIECERLCGRTRFRDATRSSSDTENSPGALFAHVWHLRAQSYVERRTVAVLLLARGDSEGSEPRYCCATKCLKRTRMGSTAYALFSSNCSTASRSIARDQRSRRPASMRISLGSATITSTDRAPRASTGCRGLYREADPNPPSGTASASRKQICRGFAHVVVRQLSPRGNTIKLLLPNPLPTQGV
jgi:hypothetical protein